MKSRTYISIDLKSFYASVECIERGLDPLKTNLVVADVSRTEKTICLAVSPSLKRLGIPGRARLFEVISKIKEVNQMRRKNAPKNVFFGESCFEDELNKDPSLSVSYIAAIPQMSKYMAISSKIYHIYLNYIAPEDIHVYSIDEVMMDVTDYLGTYHCTAQELAKRIIRQVIKETGITATAGIGSNLYLAKVAMDIMAKHVPANLDGVRIATLTEKSYREHLWDHKPLTDFWRVGRGYREKLEAQGLYTMGDIARCSIGKEHEYYNEELLYKMFGKNAELLIDHAWGWEPCTMKEIKSYKPENRCIGSGQVLHCPYTKDKCRIIVKEMIDLLVLDLVEKQLVTNQMILTIAYDIENLSDENVKKKYTGPITTDRYGRKMPKHTHGTINLPQYTSSTKGIMEKVIAFYDHNVQDDLMIRRVNITANNLINEKDAKTKPTYIQMSLFTENQNENQKNEEEQEKAEKERKLQEVMLNIKQKFGKNAILKGTNLEDGATTKERNEQIGGHKA